jgi:hypothetical protein
MTMFLGSPLFDLEVDLWFGMRLIQVDIGGHPPFHWLKIVISDWQFFWQFSGPKLPGPF